MKNFRVKENSFLRRNSKFFLIFLGFSFTLMISFIKYLTGPEWALAAFYLFPIILVTWNAGGWAGVLMIDVADAQMYFAKQNGKNQTRQKVIDKGNKDFSPLETT
jgi:hypothetical protein